MFIENRPEKMLRWEQACTYWHRVIPTKIDIYFSDYQLRVLEIFGSVLSALPFLGFLLLQTILVMADNDKWGYLAVEICYTLKSNYIIIPKRLKCETFGAFIMCLV